MRPVKDQGMKELGALRRRVSRAHAMERIGEADFKFINERLKAVEARIVSMRETNEYGKEVE